MSRLPWKRSKGKIAFLFLTRGDWNQPLVWDRFFDSADQDRFRIYCHPKEQESIQSQRLRDAVIPNRIETEIGTVSLVRATLLLLEEALKDPDNQFFPLCSESCVPIWNYPTFERILTANERSRISLFGDFEARRYSVLRDPEFLPRRRFAKQHQWMILNREAASLILAHDYTEVFADMYAADEHYFIGVLLKLNYPIQEKCLNRMTTWVNWKEREETYNYWPDGKGGQAKYVRYHPKTYHTITSEDINPPREMQCLFFRKVSQDCSSDVLLEAVSP